TVHLVAHAIQRHTAFAQVANQLVEERPLGNVSGVVVVDEQLRLGGNFMGYAKSAIDVVGSGNHEPGATAEAVRPLGIDYFVDHIPGIDIVLVMRDHAANMVFQPP